MTHDIIQDREAGLHKLEDRDSKYNKEAWGWLGVGFILTLILLANCTKIKDQFSRFLFLSGCAVAGTCFVMGKQAAGHRYDLEYDLEQETSHYYRLKAIHRGTEEAVVEITAHGAAQLAAGFGYAQEEETAPWYDETCKLINEIFNKLNVKAHVKGVEHTEKTIRYMIDRYSMELDYDKLGTVLRGSKFQMELAFHAKLRKARIGAEDGNIFIETIDPALLPANQQTIAVAGTPVADSAMLPATPAALAAARQETNGAIVPVNGIQPPPSGTIPPLAVLLGPGREDQHHRHWIPQNQSNGFVVCTGGSGAGKTEFLKVAATDIRNYGISMTIADFHGDIEVAGYQVITLATAGHLPYGINPMELDSKDPLDGGVFSQIEIIISMVKNTVNQFGPQQQFMLKAALKSAYANAGFTSDPKTWNLPSPTFRDVLTGLEIASQNEDLDAVKRKTIASLIGVIDKVFGHPVFSKPKQLSPETLAQGWYRLNMKHLTEEVKYVVAETVLRKMSRYLRSLDHIPVQPTSDRERYRWFFGVDEAKILSMGGKNKDDSAAPLQKAATEDRKFGMGLVLCSQILDHFSDELLAQMGVRIVLKPLDSKQAKSNAATIGADPALLLQLEGKGDGLLWMSNGNPPIRIGIVPTFMRPGFQPYVAQPEETIDQYEDWDSRAQKELGIVDVDAAIGSADDKGNEDDEAVMRAMMPKDPPQTSVPEVPKSPKADPRLAALIMSLQAWIDKIGEFPSDDRLRSAIEAILKLPDSERLSDQALEAIKSQLRNPPKEER